MAMPDIFTIIGAGVVLVMSLTGATVLYTPLILAERLLRLLGLV